MGKQLMEISYEFLVSHKVIDQLKTCDNSQAGLVPYFYRNRDLAIAM